VSGEQTVLVFVRMSQDERRVFLLRYRHVEADVGRLHDVARAGVQLNRRVRNVLFDADQSYTVSARRTAEHGMIAN